jgi:hypothetical protein
LKSAFAIQVLRDSAELLDAPTNRPAHPRRSRYPRRSFERDE